MFDYRILGSLEVCDGDRVVALGGARCRAVLAVLVVGFGYVRIAPEHWLRGVLIIGGDLCGAGVLRLLLPARRAGILVVRSRWFDTIAYIGLGVLVITFGVLLPQ